MVYELVSPPAKRNGQVGGGGIALSDARLSESGQHAVYSINAPLLGTGSFGQSVGYYSHRESAGWDRVSTERILPHDNSIETYSGIRPQMLSPDGRWTYMGSNVDPATGEIINNRGYAVDLLAGTATRITPPLAGDPVVAVENSVGSGVVVGDNERVVLASYTKMTTDVGGTTPAVYSLENGAATLVSRLPDGTPSRGVLANAQGPLTQRAWAVANDGRTVIWTPAANQPLYRGSVAGTASVAVNASENTLSTVTLGAAAPISATADGSKVLFSSSQQLMDETNGLTGERIYLYTHSANPATDKNLSLITTAGEPADTAAMGVVKNAQMTPDGRTIYFWTTGKQLVAGGPIGGTGQKLYRWHNGTLTYVLSATVTAANRLSQTTDDGRYYAFDSSTQLTGKPTSNTYQRYLYDAQTGAVECVSCPDSGTARAVVATRNSSAETFGTPDRRFLSPDGQVIVETPNALLPEDTNGVADVYTYKSGRPRLISSGTDAVASRFGDASVDGNTVGFMTYESLSAWDTDAVQDLYVARLDGGVPEPDLTPAPSCSGDACQGPVGPGLPTVLTGTSAFVAPGNPAVVPAPPAAAKVKVAKPKTAKGGAATLKVSVPGRGSVRVSGNGVRRATKAASGAKTVSVSVRLSARSKRQLARNGSLRLRVSVRYAPAAGAAQTTRVRVTFKKAKASSSRGGVSKGGR